MQALLTEIEARLEGPDRGDFLTELAAVVERYLSDNALELQGMSPGVKEIPDLLVQLGTAVDTSVTDEL